MSDIRFIVGEHVIILSQERILELIRNHFKESLIESVHREDKELLDSILLYEKRGRKNAALAKKRGSIPKTKSPWKEYKKQVWKLTEEQPLHILPNISLRSQDYHLDHKTSIWYGFRNGIPANEIAHISNLRIITRKANFNKGTKNVFRNHILNAELEPAPLFAA